MNFFEKFRKIIKTKNIFNYFFVPIIFQKRAKSRLTLKQSLLNFVSYQNYQKRGAVASKRQRM
jgi:hypothetical protein